VIAPFRELLSALLPEATLTLGALLVLGFDLFGGAKRSRIQRIRASVIIGLITVVGATFAAMQSGVGGPAFGDVVTLDTLGLVTRIGVLVLAALTLGLLTAASNLRHPAEYVAIVLFATAGSR
jgi:NADH-quinone oxidoreductase subunit N